MSDERREGNTYLMEAIRRIDERTEGMDTRLRNVESKLYNGINDRIDHIEEKVTLAEATALEAVQTTRRIDSIREYRKNELYKWLRVGGVVAGFIGAVVAIVSL